MIPLSSRLEQLQQLLQDAFARGDVDAVAILLHDIFSEFPRYEPEQPPSFPTN